MSSRWPVVDTKVIARRRDVVVDTPPRARVRTRSARLEPVRAPEDDRRPIAPDEASPGVAPTAPATASIDDELGHVGVSRLRAVALIAIGLRAYIVLTTLAVFLFHAARPVYLGDISLARGDVLGFWPLNVASLAASAAMIALTSSRRLRPAHVMALGVAFQIAQSLLTSLADYRAPWLAASRGIPPATLWLVIAPLVPGSTRRSTLVCFGIAAAGPVALGLASALGRPVPDALHAAYYYFPLLVAAVVATVVSSMIHQLRREVRLEKRMGSYELVERISAGGMGEVWRAHHAALARPAAIKVIHPRMLGEASSERVAAMRRHFAHEAQATASLRSPHTVQLYDFGATADGTLFYVMELLDGIDLERLVRAHGPLSPERVVHVLGQACHSLAEAHALGLIHRDIKPANVFLCAHGGDFDVVKVLDFGLVRRLGQPRDSLSGDDVPIVGTPGYVAPEVVLDEQDIDARADLYALGCVAYFLLTGRRVFEGPDAMSTLRSHMLLTPEPPRNHAPGPIPPALEQLVLDLLARNRAARPASASAVARRLAAIALDAPWTPERAAAWWRADGHVAARDAIEPADAPRIGGASHA